MTGGANEARISRASLLANLKFSSLALAALEARQMSLTRHQNMQ